MSATQPAAPVLGPPAPHPPVPTMGGAGPLIAAPIQAVGKIVPYRPVLPREVTGVLTAMAGPSRCAGEFSHARRVLCSDAHAATATCCRIVLAG